MKIITLILCLCLSASLYSQTADQLKQAQDQLKNLTPEQKKMMEQMGINTDPMSAIPKGTDRIRPSRMRTIIFRRKTMRASPRQKPY
jgi:hypothetical protein